MKPVAGMDVFERMVADFAVNELAGTRQENDRYPCVPLFEDVLAKARGVGFFSAMLPEELDGAQMSISELCMMLEEISRVDASLAAVIFTDTFAKELLYRSGNFASASAALARGNGSFGPLVAFPSHSDPADCGTLGAEPSDTGTWSVSGEVKYVVLGSIATGAVLPAGTKRKGYALLFVDLSAPGVEIGAPVASLGLRACPAVDIAFDATPATLIAAEGESAACYARVAGRMNAATAAMALGLMRGSFEEALAYARQRRQGGREIVNWSELRRILARMAVKVKAGELALSRAAEACETEEPGWDLASQAAALAITENAVEVTTDGIQALGGNGYMEDYGQEKRFRDAAQVRTYLGLAPVRELKLMAGILQGDAPF